LFRNEKIIAYQEDYPFKTIPEKPALLRCSAGRCCSFVLKIKINYIYLRQSPPKKFSFCTIFSLQKRASLVIVFPFLQVMWCVRLWKMINRSEWSRHLELTCKRKLVMWNFCSDRHYICQAQLKIFLRAVFCLLWIRSEIIVSQCYVAVILKCKIDRNIVIWWFINSLKASQRLMRDKIFEYRTCFLHLHLWPESELENVSWLLLGNDCWIIQLECEVYITKCHSCVLQVRVVLRLFLNKVSTFLVFLTVFVWN
jgi:hypothetical protein